MNKNIGIVLGIIIIAGLGFFAFSGEKMDVKETGVEVQNEMAKNNSEVTILEEKEGMVVDVGAEGSVVKVEPEVVKAGSYVAYSGDKIAMAATGDVVLFFHAAWCPSCRALNNDIEKNAGKIPTGVTILKTDYDKEIELKKKYGVTYQHTLVQVDKDGNMIKKWSGGSKLENLLSQLQ